MTGIESNLVGKLQDIYGITTMRISHQPKFDAIGLQLSGFGCVDQMT
jgi:hypothetical protein